MYTEYVIKNYGQAIVMFDGYLSSSTKDMTHQRHSKFKLVTFTESMHLTITKGEFLTNKANKQRFVNMLGETLEKKNCNVYYASADTDLLIVHKAVESATKQILYWLLMIQISLFCCAIMQV